LRLAQGSPPLGVAFGILTAPAVSYGVALLTLDLEDRGAPHWGKHMDQRLLSTPSPHHIGPM
jgi:hypothetical protein